MVIPVQACVILLMSNILTHTKLATKIATKSFVNGIIDAGKFATMEKNVENVRLQLTKFDQNVSILLKFHARVSYLGKTIKLNIMFTSPESQLQF